ncbi:hypothetical protein [Arthrobacter rhombi]|uniref:hypothetical protein n=1 Tax=Arthrobacter rhombi TaxID=71253 RepID=UPI003FD1D570
MDYEGVDERLAHQPHAPKRKFTVLDVVLIGSTPILMYGGGVLAGVGSALGIVLAGIAMFATATIRAIRISRTDEPVIASYTFAVSIGVGVVALINTVGMWRAAPVETPALLLTPLVSVALFAAYLLLLFKRRRL